MVTTEGLLIVVGVLFRVMKNIDSGMVAQLCNYTKNYLVV